MALNRPGTLTTPLAQYNSTPPSLSDGNYSPLQVNSTGQLITAGSGSTTAVTVSDGADIAEGSTTDVAVTGDNSGTISAKLRGLNKFAYAVFDQANSRINVAVTNIPLVAQSGAWTVTAIGSGTYAVSDAALELTQGSTTSGQKGILAQGAVTTNAPTYTTGQTAPLSLDTSGLLRLSLKDTPQNTTALKIDGSGVTQPVSGTFWQTTQPISAASLPLPSGASTLAKQPALGTAGSASADVITIQGIASMTAVKVDGSGVTQPVSGTFWQATQPVSGTVTSNAGTNLNTSLLALESGNLATLAGIVTSSKAAVNITQIAGTTITTSATGVQKVGIVGNAGAAMDAAGQNATSPANELLIAGQFNTTPTTITAGNVSPIQVDSKGSVRQVIQDAAGNIRGANVDANNNLGVVLPSETTKVIGTTRIIGNGGATLDVAVGATTAPTNMMAVGGIYNSTELSPTTGQSTAIQLDSKGRQRQVIMDAAGNTRGANVNSSNQLSTSIDNNPVIGAGTSIVGFITPTPSSSANGNSLSVSFINAITAKTQVASVGTRLYGVHLDNPNTAKVYAQFFNALSANVTLGTTTPYFDLIIPPASVLDDITLAIPVTFSTGLTYAFTTTATGSTAPSTGVTGVLFYI